MGTIEEAIRKQRELQKANILNSFYTDEEIQKGGKAALVGEIRNWNGKNYKKQLNGKWIEVSEHGMSKKDSEKELERIRFNDSKGHSSMSEQAGMGKLHANISKLSDKEHSDEDLGIKYDKTKKAEEIDIEKARHGRYEDTAENRKLNRVGQEYGNAAKKPEQKVKQSSSSESNENKPSGGKSLEEHAKKTSDEVLKKVLANKNAPEDLKNEAKNELTRRQGSEKKNTGSDEEWDDKVKKQMKEQTTERLKQMLSNPSIKGSSFEKYVKNELESRNEYKEEDYKQNKHSTSLKGEQKQKQEYDKKNRSVLKKIVNLEDEYFENDEASVQDIGEKIQKIISENKMSKKDFLRIYVKHGSEFTDGGGITSDDLKNTALNSIDTFNLKFYK